MNLIFCNRWGKFPLEMPPRYFEIIFEGQREDVLRPRVRQRQANGSTTEVPLASYESARNPERLQASILAALMAGVSTRDIKNIQPDPQGTSKSNVSRYWQQAGHRFVDRLRDRNIGAGAAYRS